MEKVDPRENLYFQTNYGSRRIWGPTWSDLGFKKGAKRSPRRAQNGSKTSSKLSPKSKRKNDRKMDRPRLHGGIWGWTCAAPRPAGAGGRGGINSGTKDPYPRSSTPMGCRPGGFLKGGVELYSKRFFSLLTIFGHKKA